MVGGWGCRTQGAGEFVLAIAFGFALRIKCFAKPRAIGIYPGNEKLLSAFVFLDFIFPP
jgi:hypothetical protein